MNRRTRPPAPDVSVVFSVRDAEDQVGRNVRLVAERLRSLGLSFEILAVNDACRDTSFAVLKLMEGELPELRLLPRDVCGRAFLRGVAEATAPAVLLLEAERCPPVATLGWIVGRLQAGAEAVVLRGRCLAVRKLPALPALSRARGRGVLFERTFEREARPLRMEVVGGARPRPAVGWLAPVLRLLPV